MVSMTSVRSGWFRGEPGAWEISRSETRCTEMTSRP